MSEHDDPLDELRARVEAARSAAERLADEAARPGRRPNGDAPRPAWEAPPPPGGPSPEADLHAVGVLADSIRGLVGPEIRDALADLARELLLALRALIDWCLERLEARRTGPVEVEDIPIE